MKVEYEDDKVKIVRDSPTGPYLNACVGAILSACQVLLRREDFGTGDAANFILNVAGVATAEYATMVGAQDDVKLTREELYDVMAKNFGEMRDHFFVTVDDSEAQAAQKH